MDGLSALPPNAVVYPVHAPVLISTSEYFRTLVSNWSSGLDTVITLEVEPDEVEAAKLMLEYMYKGVLPSSPLTKPQDLLKMIKLADQFGVTRFLTACNAELEKIPTEDLLLEDAITILSLPPFLLDSPAMSTARRRAEDKLHKMFGDLEGAWFDPGLRAAFLTLPFCAVKYLLGRTETAVVSENTVLVVASDWLAERRRSRERAASGAAATTSMGAAAAAGTPVGAGAGAGGAQPLAAAAAAAAAAAGGGSNDGGSARGPGIGSGSGAGGNATAGPSPACGGSGGGPGGGQPSTSAAIAAVGGDSGAVVPGPGPGGAPGPTCCSGGAGEGEAEGGFGAVSPDEVAELFSLIRIPFLTSAFLEILTEVSWLRGRLDHKMLVNALRLVKAEGRVHDLLVRSMGAAASVPRAVPERTTLEMEWRVRKADIQDLILECRNEAAPAVESTRLFSDPTYYHGGFMWKMVLFVHKKREPKKRRFGAFVDVSAAEEESVYHDFLGLTCRAVLGGEVHTPLVGMAVELQATRFSALGEERQPQRTEVAGYVEDEIPYGVYDFFRVDSLVDSDCLSPFTCHRGHLHLSCKITRCA